MTNPFINPNRCFQLDVKALPLPNDSKLPNDWLEKLKEMIASALHLDRDNKTSLARLFNSVNGYVSSKALIEVLKIIYETFPTITIDEQMVIGNKLMEEKDTCMEGFHNRVNEIINGLKVSNTIDGLLTQLRASIVYNLAAKTRNDTHNVNDFFRVANSLGYGVEELNANDKYSGGMSFEQIEKLLSVAFAEEYSDVMNILVRLLESIHGIFSNKYGYIGKLEKGTYERGVFEPCFNYLKELLPELEQECFFILDDNFNLIDFNWKYIKQLLYKKMVEGDYFFLPDSIQVCLENLLFTDELSSTQLDFTPLLHNQFINGAKSLCKLLEFIEPSTEVAIGLIEQYLKTVSQAPTTLAAAVFDILQSKFVKADPGLTKTLEDIYQDQFLAYALSELPNKNLAQLLFNKQQSTAALFVYCLRFLSKDEQFNCLMKKTVYSAGSSNAFLAGLNFPLLLTEILKVAEGFTTQQKISIFSENKDDKTFIMQASINHPELMPAILKTLESLSVEERFKLLTQTNTFGYDVFMYAARYQPTAFKELLKTIKIFTKKQQLHIFSHTDCCQQNLLGVVAGYQPTLLPALFEIFDNFDQKDQENIFQQKSNAGYDLLHISAFYNPENLCLLLKKMQCFGVNQIRSTLLDRRNNANINILERVANAFPKKGTSEFFSELLALPFELQSSLFKNKSPKALIERHYQFKQLPHEAPILICELQFQLTSLLRKLANHHDSEKSKYYQQIKELSEELLSDKQDWKTKKGHWDNTMKALAPHLTQESTLHQILSTIGNVLLCLVIIGIPKILCDLYHGHQRCGFFKPATAKMIDNSHEALTALSKII